MVPIVPPQRGSCPVYHWCTSAMTRHRAHTSEPTVLTIADGVVLRVSLVAENASPPVVQVEVAWEVSGTMLELGRFQPVEAIELAGVLLRAGSVAQASRSEGAEPQR